MAMDESPPAFWFQPPLVTNRRRTPPIDPVLLIILIPILALIFLFLLLSPVLYYTSHILKPGYVKSTWDSLNIFLVLFAILCGLMARKNDDVSSLDGFVAESSNSSSVSSSDYFDVDVYYNNTSTQIERENENLNPSIPFCPSSFRPDYQLLQQSEEEHVGISNVKEIPVDTFVVSPHAVPEQPLVKTPPPPPPPPPPSAPLYKHSFKSVGKDKLRSHPPPPSPPPPPPPRVHRSHHKHKSLERKVSDATKEIATALSSFYNPGKRKNKRKQRNTFPETERTLALPPPPPPPPPPSVFHSLFKKGSKVPKRIHSVPAPPPPPPPPSSIFNNIFKSGGKSKRFQLQSQPPPPASIMNSLFKTGTNSKRFNNITASSSPRSIVPVSKAEPQIGRSRSKGKPPRPTKTISSSYYEKEEFVMNSGSQSPLVPMPPPPPPPFKVSDMLFEVRGDFVKIRSCHSSVCSSPDHDGLSLGVDLMHGGDQVGPGSGTGCGLICFPSPDVNAKADSFISRLKHEWRMENKTKQI